MVRGRGAFFLSNKSADVESKLCLQDNFQQYHIIEFVPLPSPHILWTEKKTLGVAHQQPIKKLLCKISSEKLAKGAWTKSFDVVSEGGGNSP